MTVVRPNHTDVDYILVCAASSHACGYLALANRAHRRCSCAPSLPACGQAEDWDAEDLPDAKAKEVKKERQVPGQVRIGPLMGLHALSPSP